MTSTLMENFLYDWCRDYTLRIAVSLLATIAVTGMTFGKVGLASASANCDYQCFRLRSIRNATNGPNATETVFRLTAASDI